MVEDEKTAFRVWLMKNTSFNSKVISDTTSRLCRVEKIKSLVNSNTDIDEFLYLLGKEPTFSRLGTSVKSQLRRSCKLYYKYRYNTPGIH